MIRVMDKNKKIIYLIDLTHESELGLGSDTMPLQLGLIASYCLKKYGEQVDIKIMKFVGEFVKAVEEKPPFIIAASNYLWNIDLSYKLISLIKKKYPDVISIFGGPNYPDEYDEQIGWLKNRPYVDFYIYMDGEVPFTKLVGELLKKDSLAEVKKAKIPSCHSLVDGVPYFGELEERVKNLDDVPSPYLNGVMDKFFEFRLIPAIQTNRGCPFTCTYCTEGNKYYTMVYKTSLERRKAEVNYIVDKVKYTKTLRVTDSNFGMYADDEEFCEFLHKVQKTRDYPEYLTCSAGKNQKDRILRCNELVGGAMRVTASVQSLDSQVLENINRTNISLDDIMAMSDQVSNTDTYSYSEIILGLPGDSLEAEKKSMAGLIKSGISNITQHQLSIIYGTEMVTKKSREKYGIVSMFRPIQRCVGVYEFDNKKFSSIEIEEVCVSNNTLSYEDYIEARKLYLSVGLFYNDRIFGEIYALLEILGLSTWEWLMMMHENIQNHPEEIQKLYKKFVKDTKDELWPNPKDLIRDVSNDIDRYIKGEAGGNIIYKYRIKVIILFFNELRKTAYDSLRKYLKEKKVNHEGAVDDIEKFSNYQKSDLFNVNLDVTEDFEYDIIRMIDEMATKRKVGNLDDFKHPTRIRITHSDKQKETIKRQLSFYGHNEGGLTMLMSRFPIKKFYRKARVVEK